MPLVHGQRALAGSVCGLGLAGRAVGRPLRAARPMLPCCSRYCPATTTFWPGVKPLDDHGLAIAVSADLDCARPRPCCRRRRRRHRARSARAATASSGTTTTCFSVSTSSRVDTERPGHRTLSLFVEGRLHADRAARLVDLVVDEGEMARPTAPSGRPNSAPSPARSPASQRLVDLRHLLLGRREHHGDRLQLDDRHDAVLVGGVDDVARIDEAEAGLARQRRLDGGVAQLRLGVVDRGLVALDLRRELIDRRLLGVELLVRGEVLLGQILVALQVELRVLARSPRPAPSWRAPGRAPPDRGADRSGPGDRPP